MGITLSAIDSILVTEDIEGLIEAGAPADEYVDEAAQLTASIENLVREDINEASILALISAIWLKSFELSKDDMELRLPALRRVAHKIFNLAV